MTVPRETYLHGHHRSVLSAHSARTADDAAAFLLPHIRPGMKLVDVGCGPGTITVGLATAVGKTGYVLGIDIADGLRDEWDKRLQETEATNLAFQIDNIYETHLERDQFDVVYAHQVLQHLGDPVGALTAACSLAKSGGLVAVREVVWERSLPTHKRRHLTISVASTTRSHCEMAEPRTQAGTCSSGCRQLAS